MPTPERVIFTTMKNEGPFMLEWIAFNLSLGFDGIVIYTNDCEDGTDQLAIRLEDLGMANHVHNPVKVGGNPQHQALRRARNHPWVQRAKWLMCLDVDEFLNVRVGNRTLDDLINAVSDKDAVSVAWKLFGCGGKEAYEDQKVTQQFFWADHETDGQSGRSYGFKTLFRNNGSFGRFGPHRPKDIPAGREGSIRWSDASGVLHPAKDVGWRVWEGFGHEFARIHHYSVRSVESFMVKRDRGRTNHINVDQSEIYWRDMNVNRYKDSSIVALSDRANIILEELMSDPVLSRLHIQACDWHQAKIEELKERPDWEGFSTWLHENKM